MLPNAWRHWLRGSKKRPVTRGRTFRPRLEPLEDRTLLSTFTVVNTSDAGAGSLRQAILDANAHQGADVIQFNLAGSGVHTIQPLSGLPIITDAVAISGGGAQIQIDGSQTAFATGLSITADACTIDNLEIINFPWAGIYIAGNYNSATNNRLSNNANGVEFGSGHDNTIAHNTIVANRSVGVLLNGDTHNNDFAYNNIGADPLGSSPGNPTGVILQGAAVAQNYFEHNVISSNIHDGVDIKDHTHNNVFVHNFIGTDATGTQSLGNGECGVLIVFAANANTLQGNVISANGSGGVGMNGWGITGTDNNVLVGNFIGTDATGTAKLPNGANPGAWPAAGVAIGDGCANNQIGDGTAAGRNIISGNVGMGVALGNTADNSIAGNYIGADASGMNPLGNGWNGIYVLGASHGTQITGNVIADSGLAGIQIDSSDNTVAGNFIGANADGSAALGNHTHGVLIQGPDNIIGGAAAAARNIVSGNALIGIFMNGVTGNVVEGNFIGTNAAGAAAIPNGQAGVWIEGGSNNTIGGTMPGQGNLISGNSTGAGDLGIGIGATADDIVQGNRIGTDATGTIAIPNDEGIAVRDSTNILIGGTIPGARNLISGNVDSGINVFFTYTPNPAPTQGTTIEGNYIGTNAGGAGAVGNGNFGVTIADASHCTVDSNVISGNGQLTAGLGAPSAAVVVAQYFNSAQFNTVTNNRIGTAADATTPIPNYMGMFIGGGTQDNTIDGNVIANSLFQGIEMGGDVGLPQSTPTSGNHVSGNTITNNGFDGVDIINGVGQIFDGTQFIGPSLGVNNNFIQSNRIADNAGSGLVIDGIGADKNVVYGNTITGNDGAGVGLLGGAHGNVIGDAGGLANSISANDGAGILIRDQAQNYFPTPTGLNDVLVANAPPTNTTIRGNAIYGNGGPAIDVRSIGQFPGAPLVTVVSGEGNASAVGGSMNGTPSTTFTLDFYASAATDPGAGQAYLGSRVVTTDANGHAPFVFFLSGCTVGKVVTATATDAAGNTSSFSAPQMSSATRVATSTTVSASAAPTALGAPVTLMAAITPADTGGGVFTGSIDFVDATTGMDLGVVPITGTNTFLTTTALGAGPHAITAIYSGDNGFVGSTSEAFHVTVIGSTRRISISAPFEVTAGDAFTITVRATDQFGTTTPNYWGTVHFTSSDHTAGILLPDDWTFTSQDQGVHTFVADSLAGIPRAGVALDAAGYQDVAATDVADNTIAGDALLHVNATTANHFDVIAVGGTPAGAPLPVSITALDRFGNTATGYRGTVHFTSTDPAASLPADYAFSSADNGVHPFRVTLRTPGNQTIMATDFPFSGGLTVTVFPTDVDVEAGRATALDANRVIFSYVVHDSAAQPFTVGVYRSATPFLDLTPSEVYGGYAGLNDATQYHTIQVGNFQINDDGLAVGEHANVPLMLQTPLIIDPAHPYVFVVADPAHQNAGVNQEHDRDSFRKFVIAEVSHGLSLSGHTAQWQSDLCDALVAQGYDKSLIFDWAQASRKPIANQAVDAGDRMADELIAAVNALGAGPNDVVDVHLIGHSRGAVVISQAATHLDPNDTNLPTQMRHGILKLTMLDPHPANVDDGFFDAPNYDPGPVGRLAQAVIEAYYVFCAGANDPNPVVPSFVYNAEVYYQNSPATPFLPATEPLFNLQGIHPVAGSSNIATGRRSSSVTARCRSSTSTPSSPILRASRRSSCAPPSAFIRRRPTCRASMRTRFGSSTWISPTSVSIQSLTTPERSSRERLIFMRTRRSSAWTQPCRES